MYILWENNIKVSAHVDVSATFNLNELEMWGMVHALNNLLHKICHICRNHINSGLFNKGYEVFLQQS